MEILNSRLDLPDISLSDVTVFIYLEEERENPKKHTNRIIILVLIL
jgi:hypothetical protein